MFKGLIKQTFIYGLSSILVRFLNYLLVPLYTKVFLPEEYGVVTELYAYVAFVSILLLYGMETAYFRYSEKQECDESSVFSAGYIGVVFSVLSFIFLILFGGGSLADTLHYGEFKVYLYLLATVIVFDALTALPMARLRRQQKALKFAGINVLNISVNIGLNLFLILYVMPSKGEGWLGSLYIEGFGVGYIFVANLLASVIRYLVFVPSLIQHEWKWDCMLYKEMFFYAFPLLILGLSGMVNETIDRILLKYLLIDELGKSETMATIGVYGACYKLSIIVTLFIQAFRYAAEPFFFSKAREQDAKLVYAKVMNYFVLVCVSIFLLVMLFIDYFKFFISDQAYWVGLKVVPILLMANIFLGIYYNLSVWYKLSDKTRYGAYVGGVGVLVTIVLNLLWIPQFTFVGAAWATFFCYLIMVILSYILGQRHYSIPYSVWRILIYILLSWVVYYLSTFLSFENSVVNVVVKALLLIGFVFVLVWKERPKKIVS